MAQCLRAVCADISGYPVTMPYSVVRRTVRRNVRRWSAAGMLALVAVTGCSTAGSGDASAPSTVSVVEGAISPEALDKVQALNINRSCGTVGAGLAACVAVTADKIALATELQTDLKELPTIDISTEASQVAGGIADRGKEWARLGCPVNWVPDCAGVAMAVESDFSVLAAYVIQLTSAA